MKLCPYCSGEIKLADRVCTHCGMKIESNKEKQTTSKQKQETKETYEDGLYQAMGLEKIGPLNKWITLILCIFLGIFGVHKLYERKYTMALFYLFTGGFCGIGVLLDIFLILQKQEKYYVYKQRVS